MIAKAMIVNTTCKELIEQKHPYVKNEKALRMRFEEKCVNITLGIKALYINLFTEYKHPQDTFTLKASVLWCFSNEGNTKEFPYNESGFEAACKWVDEQRVMFAKQLVE